MTEARRVSRRGAHEFAVELVILEQLRLLDDAAGTVPAQPVPAGPESLGRALLSIDATESTQRLKKLYKTGVRFESVQRRKWVVVRKC